jgi:hypothetical protein
VSGFAHDLAGGNGNLIIASFQSPNFVAGVSGWQVTITGDAEFNSVVVRGEIEATEFSAEVTVSAGPYAGTYLIQTGQLTDPTTGDVLAAISWANSTNPATLTPYIAGVSSTDAGNIASLHSGMDNNTDSDCAIWLLSANANNGSAALFLVDAPNIQFFGGDGPTLYPNGGGWAVDPWHPMTLINGWVNGSSPNVQCQYRYTVENEIEVIGTLAGSGSSSSTFCDLPVGYQPGSQQMVPAQSTSATAGNYFIQVGTSGSMSVQGASHTGTYVFHGSISLDA